MCQVEERSRLLVGLEIGLLVSDVSLLVGNIGFLVADVGLLVDVVGLLVDLLVGVMMVVVEHVVLVLVHPERTLDLVGHALVASAGDLVGGGLGVRLLGVWDGVAGESSVRGILKKVEGVDVPGNLVGSTTGLVADLVDSGLGLVWSDLVGDLCGGTVSGRSDRR